MKALVTKRLQRCNLSVFFSFRCDYDINSTTVALLSGKSSNGNTILGILINIFKGLFPHELGELHKYKMLFNISNICVSKRQSVLPKQIWWGKIIYWNVNVAFYSSKWKDETDINDHWKITKHTSGPLIHTCLYSSFHRLLWIES